MISRRHLSGLLVFFLPGRAVAAIGHFLADELRAGWAREEALERALGRALADVKAAREDSGRWEKLYREASDLWTAETREHDATLARAEKAEAEQRTLEAWLTAAMKCTDSLRDELNKALETPSRLRPIPGVDGPKVESDVSKETDSLPPWPQPGVRPEEACGNCGAQTDGKAWIFADHHGPNAEHILLCKAHEDKVTGGSFAETRAIVAERKRALAAPRQVKSS